MITRHNDLIEGGKYEVALTLSDPQTAQSYLTKCVQDAIKAGIDPKLAEAIEKENIFAYARGINEGMERRLRRLLG